PDPMPNSEVKRRSADGSVGSPHARVGNCQASNQAKGHPHGWPFCVCLFLSDVPLTTNHKRSRHIYGKLAVFLSLDSVYESLPQALEYVWYCTSGRTHCSCRECAAITLCLAGSSKKSAPGAATGIRQ